MGHNAAGIEVEAVNLGDHWSTPGGFGHVELDVLTEPFEHAGELWVTVKQSGHVRPDCVTVSWILAGGERTRP